MYLGSWVVYTYFGLGYVSKVRVLAIRPRFAYRTNIGTILLRFWILLLLERRFVNGFSLSLYENANGLSCVTFFVLCYVLSIELGCTPSWRLTITCTTNGRMYNFCRHNTNVSWYNHEYVMNTLSVSPHRDTGWYRMYVYENHRNTHIQDAFVSR